MKIKCPSCQMECDFLTPDYLVMHFQYIHKISDTILAKQYAELYIKIHEKIKCFQSEIKDNHFEDCDSGHDFETHQNMVFAIEELKSLLEDNQK